MRFEFDAAGTKRALVDGLDPAYTEARREKDVGNARRLILDASASPAARQDLRTFLVRTEGVTGAAALSQAEVTDRLSWMLVLGDLRVDTVGRKAIVLPEGAPPPAVAAAPPPKRKDAASNLTWIAVELVDEEDRPVPGEEYEIEFPDGQVQRGKLDVDGQVTIQAIRNGNCKVRFPALDRDAWEKV